MTRKHVIGIDFGTDSVRALVMDAMNGKQISTSVSRYARWSRGLYCDASVNQFRQHPADYVDGLIEVVTECLAEAGEDIRRSIAGISVATTGSTPVAVNQQGKPLALLPEFQENPNAMFVLWKDHTATAEADEINAANRRSAVDYLKYVGGTYSSEWFWAKLLHIIRADESVRRSCYSWVEHSDWMPFLLTGGTDAHEMQRNVCAAGHKGLWAAEFGGLPPASFFESVDPALVPYASRYGQAVCAADKAVGNLSEEWAERLGLSTNVVVGVGAIDAHVGAVGSNIRAYHMSKVLGTSTCDMMVVPREDMKQVFIEGISGQVEGSIIPGMVGLEAGQSAFGDVYSWLRDFLLWPVKNILPENSAGMNEVDILAELGSQAAALPVKEGSEFALDWFNGRRTPFADPYVKGLIGGLTLGSTPAHVFRALVEATCFGSRAIVESIEKQGLKIQGFSAMGGIALKSRFVMQTLADVLNRPVEVSAAEQPVALGAAMLASVASGIHDAVESAAEKMGVDAGETFYPRQELTSLMDRKYENYKRYGAMESEREGSTHG